MFKIAVVVFAFLACAAAKPSLIGAPLAYSAPVAVVAAAPAPFVTATSSQVVARNFNGIAHAPVFAAPVARPIAPAIAAAPLAYPAAVPLAARYLAAPYTAAYAPSYHYAAARYVF